MTKNREIKIATITITVMRRKKHSLVPGWEYGTHTSVGHERDLTPKDERIVGEMFDSVRKAL